jgi:hypothetical protein
VLGLELEEPFDRADPAEHRARADRRRRKVGERRVDEVAGAQHPQLGDPDEEVVARLALGVLEVEREPADLEIELGAERARGSDEAAVDSRRITCLHRSAHLVRAVATRPRAEAPEVALDQRRQLVLGDDVDGLVGREHLAARGVVVVAVRVEEVASIAGVRLRQRVAGASGIGQSPGRVHDDRSLSRRDLDHVAEVEAARHVDAGHDLVDLRRTGEVRERRPLDPRRVRQAHGQAAAFGLSRWKMRYSSRFQ